MNDDLISREALKEALNYIYDCAYIDSKSKEGIASDIIADIDNAPTVDIKDQIAGAYNEGYMCGSREAEKARPQGEWKEYKLRNDIVVEYAFKCSNCKKDSGLLYRANFCPNCGADMKGGAE